MRHHRLPVLLLALLVTASCSDLTSPSFNNPSAESLTEDPTRAAVAAMAQGLLAGQRGLTQNFVVTLGIWGREGYNLRPEEPRSAVENLVIPIFREGDYWNAQYTQIQNIFLLLDMVERTSALTEQEKAAMRGFANTLMAEAYFQVILMHDQFGAPIDVNREPGGELAPIESPEAVFEHVFALYDQAVADLNAGGGAFPFQFTAGLADFNTPQTFLQLNRALTARALKYRGRWADVLAMLPETFIDAGAPLSSGAYHNYSTGTGDAINSLAENAGQNLFAHPRLLDGAQRRADDTRDLRAQDKLAPVEPNRLHGIDVSEAFAIYDDLDDPIPWIRNEELILMRAEANLALGNASEAIADINLVRVEAGGLEPIPDPFSGDLLGELLYNKRYSLMWEGGFTYLDARQYDRMGDEPDELPRALSDHVVYMGFGFPQNECIARGVEGTPPCQPIEGF